MKREFDEFIKKYEALNPDELLQELEDLGISFSDYSETEIYTLPDIGKYSSEIGDNTNNLLLCA